MFTQPLEKILHTSPIPLHPGLDFSCKGNHEDSRGSEVARNGGETPSKKLLINSLIEDRGLSLGRVGIEASPKSSGKKLLVVKFGGSVLRDASSIRRAAEAVGREYEEGFLIVVVVSAMKGVTDRLISLAKSLSPNIDGRELDRILAMGEEESARLMAAALRSQGLEAVEVTPQSPLWPIITDERHGDAEPLEEPSRERAKRLLTLLEEGRIPVVCGFLGMSRGGEVTTLGRGGSDTTAMLLANYLDADELVLVKDVDGIFSADPGRVKDPRRIESLDVEEAYILSSGGAKILHSKSFKYKPEGLQVRLVSLGESLTRGGTIINGSIPELEITLYKNPIHMITLVGNPISDLNVMARIYDEMRGNGGNLISLTLRDKAAILYFEGNPIQVLERAHEVVKSSKHLKALSQYEDLAMITVSGVGLETTPGFIKRVTEPLAEAGINIYGLLTIASSISIFVNREERDKAFAMIEKTMKYEGSYTSKPLPGRDCKGGLGEE